MSERFFAFSEDLWRSWLPDTLDAPTFVRPTFDLEAAPEPYVAYGVGRRPLVALLTNPGYTMPHQLRSAVEAGDGPQRSRGMEFEPCQESSSAIGETIPPAMLVGFLIG